MDKELEQAQGLTKDDLLAKLEHGRPAKLARPRDPNQRGKAVVDAATREKPRPRGMVLWNGEEPQDTIVLTRVELEPIHIRRPKQRTSTEA